MSRLIISPRKLGLGIMTVAPLAAAAYIIAVVFFRDFVLEITALTFMTMLLGVVTWIGYTMLTEPLNTRPQPSEADMEDLTPETLNAKPSPRSSFSLVKDCSIGEGTIIRDQVNLFKCTIGQNCKIESFVYIEEGVVVGDRCKIKPNVFIPTGVMIEDDVFIGPNATFTNDKHPRANGEWELLPTKIGRGASIGAHAVILPGITIGENAVIGAGAVVTKDVPPNMIAVGNPAKILAKSAVPRNLVLA